VDRLDKLGYFLWAASRWPMADRRCPSCDSSRTTLVKHKAVVTSLYRCEDCYLLFRVPKSSARETQAFYQRRYRSGFTTDCPAPAELERLKRASFRGSPKDYEAYLAVLKAAGLRPGQVVLDFGASWGYGSWQLSQAGYHVYSFEVSEPRARYAAEQLECRILADPTAMPELADCLFAAHVIEHLPNPRTLWQTAAQVVRPGGWVVLFTPNGDLGVVEAMGGRFHQMWGQVHPVVLSPESLGIMARHAGFVGQAHCSPYDLVEIEQGRPGQSLPGELSFIARREAEGSGLQPRK
jgi:2-polyprenyl-3-methyl-5-hydroxy-6-metoxy-1,4-benzoquinol methylase